MSQLAAGTRLRVPSTLTLIEAIQTAGLTTGLQICLDAGDALSWPGSGDKWLDRSGNGFDFFLGSDGATASEKPTFNGTAGGKSKNEFWSFDGGDFFRLADSSNAAWMNEAAHDNAEWGHFWLLRRIGDLTVFNGLAGVTGGAANIGWQVELSTSNRLFTNMAASGSDATFFGRVLPSDGGFHALSTIIDEGAGAQLSHHCRDNDSSSLFTATYSTPTSSDASYKMEIGAIGNGANKISSNVYLAGCAFWFGSGTKPTLAKLQSLWVALLPRFG